MTKYKFNSGTYDAIKFRDELCEATNPPMTAWDMVGRADWRRLFHRFLEDQVLLLGTEELKGAVDFMAALSFLLDDNRAPNVVFAQTASDEMAARFQFDLAERYFPAAWSRETGEVYQEWTETKADSVLRQQLLNDATDRVSRFWDDFLEFWQATRDGEFDALFPSEKERLADMAADLPDDALDTFLEDESKGEEERALRRQARSLDDNALDRFLDREEENRQAQLQRDLEEEIDDDDDQVEFSIDQINDQDLLDWNAAAMKAMSQDERRRLYQVASRIFIDGAPGQKRPNFVIWASQSDAGPAQVSGWLEMTKKGSGPFPGSVTAIGPFSASVLEPAIKAFSKKKVVIKKS